MIRRGLGIRRVVCGAVLSLAVHFSGHGPGLVASPVEEPKPAAKGNAGDPQKPAAKPKPKPAPSLDWLTLDVGLAQVRKKYLPALILCDARAAAEKKEARDARDAPPAEANDSKPAFLEDILADSAMKETIKRFVLIRITPADLEKPYPLAQAREETEKKEPAKKAAPKPAEKKPRGAVKDEAPGDPTPPADPQAQPVDPALGVPATIGARLGLSGAQSAIVVINYWEDSVLTYKEGNPPTRTRLKDELTKVWKVNMIYAEERRKVEPEVEKSRYAAKLGNLRDAVMRVRGYEDPKTQTRMDPNLKKRLNELLLDYRAKAQKQIEEANKLDTAKKYQEAIQAFDKIMVDYPFQDVLQQANKRKNECLRKLTIGF